MTCFCISLALLMWLTVGLVAGDDTDIELELTGECPDNKPPLCPFCSGLSVEECDSLAVVESCKLTTDTCVLTSLINQRGVVEMVSRGCGPMTSESCPAAGETLCVDNDEDQRLVRCSTCDNQLRTCPWSFFDFELHRTAILTVLVSCGCVVSVIYAVGAVKHLRNRRTDSTRKRHSNVGYYYIKNDEQVPSPEICVNTTTTTTSWPTKDCSNQRHSSFA